MAEKPILFSIPMVQAILAGHKTITRRVIKPQPRFQLQPRKVFEISSRWNEYSENPLADPQIGSPWGYEYKCPWMIGDILWVRETWFRHECDTDCEGREDESECPFNHIGNYCYGYKAQYSTGGHEDIKWKPSIYMPREACRLFLRVKNVRVERLQDITIEDVTAEGIDDVDNDILNPDPETHESIKNWNCQYAQFRFKELWDRLNAKRGYGWDVNPWVWVILFERTEAPA